MLLEAIEKFIRDNGLHSLTVNQIRAHIKSLGIPGLVVPCARTVSKILKEKFHLRFHKYDGAIAKYRDPLYTDRRLWLARVLTQLICEEVLIISIDETHFRSDVATSKKWQVASIERKNCTVLKAGTKEKPPRKNRAAKAEDML